jgi:hypothetical protein
MLTCVNGDPVEVGAWVVQNNGTVVRIASIDRGSKWIRVSYAAKKDPRPNSRGWEFSPDGWALRKAEYSFMHREDYAGKGIPNVSDGLTYLASVEQIIAQK